MQNHIYALTYKNIYQGQLPTLNLKKLMQHCVIATLSCWLSGCMGVYEGGFECPPGEGVGCKSISYVNDMVNKGELVEKLPTEAMSSCERCGQLRQLAVPLQKPLSIWYAPGAIEGEF